MKRIRKSIRLQGSHIDDEPESEATPEETQQDITPSDEADIEDFSTSDKY